jgi:hypothetical protein
VSDKSDPAAIQFVQQGTIGQKPVYSKFHASSHARWVDQARGKGNLFCSDDATLAGTRAVL